MDHQRSNSRSTSYSTGKYLHLRWPSLGSAVRLSLLGSALSSVRKDQPLFLEEPVGLFQDKARRIKYVLVRFLETGHDVNV
jgi:hypothetical protein